MFQPKSDSGFMKAKLANPEIVTDSELETTTEEPATVFTLLCTKSFLVKLTEAPNAWPALIESPG